MSRRTLVVAALFAATFFALFAPLPDDWDGLGFLASVTRFDLASFSPHPPGYPVYVALLKLAAAASGSPILAARLVAALSGLVTFLALAVALGTEETDPALAAGAVCLAPLVFRAFTGVGSEGPALAFAAVAAAGIFGTGLSPRSRALLVGVGVGLGLGVRISWAPFYLAFLLLAPRGGRLVATALTLCLSLAWAVPLALLTGPRVLAHLLSTHFEGHMNVWGDTYSRQPVRFPFFARDVLFDGLGGGADALGAVVLVLSFSIFVLALRPRLSLARTPMPERQATALAILALTVPYAAWLLLGQNLRFQPRHVVPLVALGVGVLARLSRTRPRLAFIAFMAALGSRSAQDAVARQEIPPPGAQLLAYLRRHASELPIASTALYTGQSARFLDGTEWQPRTFPRERLGDVELGVSRMDRLPDRVLVTNEVADLDEAKPPPTELASFCRPVRLERRLPCLTLYVLGPRSL